MSMRDKAERKQHARQYDENGLPRDARDWTRQDWQDLHEAVEDVKRKIASRHQSKEQPQ